MIVVGHRGWRLKCPENTLAGFRAAIELGVDAIELDLHLTKDNHLVVIHDQDTERTTGVAGSVREMTLSEVRRLDAGRWFGEEFAGERIPTLEEVLELADGKTAVAIEVKPPGNAGARINEKLVPLVRNFRGTAIVHSFDADYLCQFRAACPEIDTGLLCMASAKAIAEAKAIGCAGIHPAWQSVTPEMNLAIRKEGLRILVWTARNEEDCLKILASFDVDAVGVDCPDILIRLLRERGER